MSATGPRRTAAGATAGLDLALALVEEDLGREVALKVAGQLVMFFKRPEGQTMLSQKGEAVLVGRSALQEAQRWIAANPSEDLSIANLAKKENRPQSPSFDSRVPPGAWGHTGNLGERSPCGCPPAVRSNPAKLSPNKSPHNADSLALTPRPGLRSSRRRHAR